MDVLTLKLESSPGEFFKSNMTGDINIMVGKEEPGKPCSSIHTSNDQQEPRDGEKATISKPVKILLHQGDHIKELFKGLKIADCSRFAVPEEEVDTPARVRDHLIVSDVMTCSHCRATFGDRRQQVEHYKTDLHKYNVKRSAAGLVALTERELVKLGIDDDVLSISGSESEDEAQAETIADRDDDSVSTSESAAAFARRCVASDERELRRNQLQRHTKLFLVNASRQMFCLYKCLIMSKWVPTGDSQVELAVKQLVREPRMAVFLLAGGHFAAAVFSGGKAVLHKTFHSYTVRAKQGGSQSSRDGRSATSHCRSAGASLRRYNEASLTQHIQELVGSWEPQLARCSFVFVRALGGAAGALYGGRAPPLSRRDPRIRAVPFPTRRPTNAEVERVYTELTTVYVYGTDVDVNLGGVPRSPPKPETPARAPRRSPRADTTSPASPAAASSRTARLTARDRRNSERQLELQEAAELAGRRYSSDESDAEYEVRQLRGLADLSTFGPEEAFDSSVPLDSPVVTATEERRRRREFRRRLRQQQQEEQADVGETTAQLERPPETAAAQQTPPEPDGAEQYRVQCYTLCKTGDAAALRLLLSADDAPVARHRLLSWMFGQAQQTVLHAASRAGHSSVVRLLLEREADPTCRDVAGQAPYDVATDKEVRNEFRRYRAAHPDQHNYAKAHVPEPLTEEMEEDKRQRDAAKKKQQNQKRKEKLKEKKAMKKIEDEADREAKKEEEERQRFLKLSDREKRALAAERRISQLATQAGAPPPVLVRCCQCAADMTGRVPFTYADNVFCTTSCVSQHRAAAAAAVVTA